MKSKREIEIIIFLAIGLMFVCWQPLSNIYDFIDHKTTPSPVNLSQNVPTAQKPTIFSSIADPVYQWVRTSWLGNYALYIIFKLTGHDFMPVAFVNLIPPSFLKTEDGQITIGPQGPFFMMVKIYMGKDKNYGYDGVPGDKVQFEIMEGSGVIKPLSPGGTVSEALVTPGLYTFTTDQQGQVRAVFYPSPSSTNSEYYIVATVLNNPRLTNRIEFFWKTSPLNDQYFHDTIQKFVDWHNKTRLINRTEDVVDYPDYSFLKTWQEVYAPQPAAPYTLTVRNGVYEDRGNSMPSTVITYGSFLQLTGRQPWGIDGNDVILYSKDPDGSFVLWFYDKYNGVLTERITIPTVTTFYLNSSEADMEYQNINGTLFQSSQLYQTFYGSNVMSKSLSKMTVTLAPADKGNVANAQSSQ